jgi:hypothetical protein
VVSSPPAATEETEGMEREIESRQGIELWFEKPPLDRDI